MSVFFAFSDESGKYKKERTDKFISKNPFYCRSAVFLEAEDWLALKDEFNSLKKSMLRTSPQQEVKWSYIWSLFKHFQKKEDIPKNKPYFSLRNHPLDRLVEFIRHTLQLLNECPSCRVILTLTFNERKKTRPVEIKEILKLHMSHILSVIEEEMNTIPESICVVFLNREEPALERRLKEALTEIYQKDRQSRFPHIKDSLDFEYFTQSFGSQLADYYAGVFNGCCRLYPQSIDLFRHQVWPKIAKKKDEVLGNGITEIPEDGKNRAFLKGILDKVFEAQEKDYRVSLESKLK
jgi:hypothetical protein